MCRVGQGEDLRKGGLVRHRPKRQCTVAEETYLPQTFKQLKKTKAIFLTRSNHSSIAAWLPGCNPRFSTVLPDLRLLFSSCSTDSGEPSPNPAKQYFVVHQLILFI